MRTAIISDIHGNLHALESVLKYCDSLAIDQMICLGDVVGYGAYPNQCVDLVRERCTICVKGNHDSAAIGETPLRTFNKLAATAIRWTQKELHEQSQAFLTNLPLISIKEQMTIVHASPHNPSEWTYVADRYSAEDAFDHFTTSLCFIGHTHVPYCLSEDGKLNNFRSEERSLINVGSIGQPRDGNPAAAFGVFDAAAIDYTLHRVPYDISTAAKAIKDAGLPAQLADRLFVGG